MKIQEYNLVQQKILNHTINLIGKKGHMDIPVREIAETAEVNVAAINYHFASKDRMLSLLEKYIIERFTEVVNLLFNKDKGPEERLLNWSEEVIFYTQMYSGIIILVNKKIESKPQDQFGKTLANLMKKTFKELRNTMSLILKENNKDIIDFKVSILTSSIVFPFTLSQNNRLNKKLMKQPEERRRFLKTLIHSLTD